MNIKKKANFSAYITTPLMIMSGFILASLIFGFILKNPAPIPIFIIFGLIQTISMTFFALLPNKGKIFARMTSMLIIGLFIMVLAGILGRNNFQLEGFFFYLISGTMSGVIVHFSMAKILGPIFFSRNWCSWGCWTAMVLDLLPYKNNTSWKKGLSPNLRYLHFSLCLLLTFIMYFGLQQTIIHTDITILKKGMGTFREMIWFIVGNLTYYLIGISLAIKLKDNRAFCKYICPLTVFLRLANRITLLRIKGQQSKCTDCQNCVKKCPMSIDIPKYIQAGQRVKSTECILCMNCIAACPEAILKSSIGLDFANKDYLQ